MKDVENIIAISASLRMSINEAMYAHKELVKKLEYILAPPDGTIGKDAPTIAGQSELFYDLQSINSDIISLHLNIIDLHKRVNLPEIL